MAALTTQKVILNIDMLNRIKRYLLIILLLLIIFPPQVFQINQPVYKFVLDPGHGGISLSPISKHGDRYDQISGTYLDYYKAGTAFQGLYEHIIVYQISTKVNTVLYHCSPNGNFEIFKQILQKYTDTIPKRVYIATDIIRKRSVSYPEAIHMRDPNRGYRFFDYPIPGGGYSLGRISRINALRPQMVLSLHMATYKPIKYTGINPVIVAPHDILKDGLAYLRGDIKDNGFFYKSPYFDWFSESGSRTDFQWFLADSALYFTGYKMSKNRSINKKNFSGYRHNMITWAYKDEPGWSIEAAKHTEHTKYSWNYKNFKPEGKFWDRERSKYEKYRRDGGEEGFGGDNAYASYEIIRYILYSLYKHNIPNPVNKPDKPLTSVWIMPLHVNAINPFLELGYLIRKIDRDLLVHKQQEIAEGIAVAIYSLFAGLELKKTSFRYMPKGKKIDLEKYNTSNGKSYFDMVVE